MRLSFCYLLLMTHLSCGPTSESASEPATASDIDLTTLNIDKTKTSIFISKKKYELSLLQEDEVLRTWKIVLGSNPTGDKWRQGDGCTPEGDFKVRDLYPHRKWSKFIWIDYPNDESRKKHAWAKAEGLIDSGADIGGEVGIHGTPQGAEYWIDENLNWTLGCVSLKNADIDELYKYIKKGTPIHIE